MEGRVRRGEIWTISASVDYAGKPRPAVIIQDDKVADTASVTICAFTTNETEASLFRLVIQPTPENGLRQVCRLMVDKIQTVPKTKLGKRLGSLDDEHIEALNQAIIVFLGLAAPAGRNRR